MLTPTNILQRLLRLFRRELWYIGGSDTLPPPLPREEEGRCLAAAAAGDEAAKRRLIEHNLRLVVYIARRFENASTGLEDLISMFDAEIPAGLGLVVDNTGVCSE